MTNNPYNIKKMAKKRRSSDALKCYFMATLEVAIKPEEDGAPNRRRTVNVLLESESPQLSKKNLDETYKAALKRIEVENQVDPDQVVDVVFLNMFLLGQMAPADFYGLPSETQELDSGPAPTQA